MSTSEPAAAGDDSFMDYGEERTQPTQEILNALSSLSSPMKTELEQPQGSEYETLRAQLTVNPHDPDGWRRLVNLAEETGDIEKISTTYDALLKQYPNTVCLNIVVSFFPFTLFLVCSTDSVY